jgi:hypothetical protein
MHSLFDQYQVAIRALPDRAEYSRSDLLVPELLIDRDARLYVYYAPFDWANAEARVTLLGITPGWTQMALAYRGAKDALDAGQDGAAICREAKLHGSFAGPLRKNLVAMLDDIGLPDALGLTSASELFGAARPLLHTSSVIRYPVFAGETNYTGHPPPTKSPLLMRFARNVLAPELALVGHALIVPLGKAVECVLDQLAAEGLIGRHRWLSGFPHPSGANGHRVRLFRDSVESLRRQVAEWADHRATAS